MTNLGSVIGGEPLALTLDGEEIDTQFVHVTADDETQVDFPLRFAETGEHEIGVGPSGEEPVLSRTVTVESRSAEAAAFEYTDLSIPGDAAVDGPVEIPVTVENTGEESSVQIVELTADDAVIGAEYVVLEPGDRQDLTFTHRFEEAGTYEIALEDLDSQSIEVE